MRWPPIPSLNWLRALALGCLVAATVKGAAASVGGSPINTMGALAVLLSAMALGPRLAGLLASFPAPSRSALALLPALGLLLADPLLGALGALASWTGLGIGQIHGLLFVLGVLALAPTFALPPAGGLLVAVGLSLGAWLPPAVSAAVAGLILGFSGPSPLDPLPSPVDLPFPTPERAGARLARALATLVLVVAGASAWLGLRAALDPGARGALITLGFGLLGAGLTRRLSASRGALSPGLSLVLAGAALPVVWVGLGQAPGALDGLAQMAGAAGGIRGALLLDLPLALIGLGAGGLVGAVWGGTGLGAGGLALALGGLAGVVLMDMGGLALPAVAGLLSLGLLVLGPSRGAQLAGIALGVACFGAAGWAPAPDPERLIAGRYAHLQGPDDLRRDQEIRARQRSAGAGWSGGVAMGVRAPEETWSAGPTPSRVSREVHVELDGLVEESPSRAAAAEALAGLVGGLLAPRPERALLLGDEAGNAHRALIGGVSRLVTAVAAPRALRAVASLDPGAERAWLLPGAQLLPAHPALALRLAGQQDLIVDIARVPTADGARAALDADRVRAAARRLGPDGVYVLCLQLGRLPPGGPEAATRAVLDRFAQVQLWLPPTGADSLIVVGSNEPLSLSRLLDRAARRKEALAALSLSEPIDLAGLAVADAEAARAWAAAPTPGALERAFDLPNLTRPVQHLTRLAGHTAAPAAIWSMKDAAQVEPLQARIRARESFLEVLGEAATGDLEAVFARARLLLSESGSAGSATLDPLLEPHLQQGREALETAKKEGLTSPAWDAARASAVTAQMLNPSSPLPYELQGEIALAQGNATQARQQFQAALEAEPDRPGALTGLARAWRLMGETAQAEEALRRAARVSPRNAGVWQNLGVFLLETGRLAEAEEHLRRAAALDESSAAPHLALSELALNRGDATRALVEVERALRIENTGYGWYLRGRAHFALEQLDLAEEDFRNAVLAEPGLAEARGAIGHIQALRGDLPAAAESFKAVLLAQPDNSAARENLKRVNELLARQRPEGLSQQ